MKMMKLDVSRIFILAFAIILGSITLAGASLYDLHADSQYGHLSDFTIRFNDDGDTMFQLPELVSWTGMASYGVLYDILHGVPDISGFATEGGTAYDTRWHFQASSGGYVAWLDQTNWDYTKNEVVPLPPPLILLGSGLIGLLAFRRKNRK